MSLVRSTKSHRYASKMRNIGEEYEITNRSHLRLYIALGWVEEVRETFAPPVVVQPKAAPVVEDAPKYPWAQLAPAEYRTAEVTEYQTVDMTATEKPKRKYTRRAKTAE